MVGEGWGRAGVDWARGERVVGMDWCFVSLLQDRGMRVARLRLCVDGVDYSFTENFDK